MIGLRRAMKGSGVRNIADGALALRDTLAEGRAPLVHRRGHVHELAGRRYAATEIDASRRRAQGMRVAAAKLSGVACAARHAQHGRPRRGGDGELSRLRAALDGRRRRPRARGEGHHRAAQRVARPTSIVIELGDGILGGYSVESVFDDEELRAATAAHRLLRVGLRGRVGRHRAVPPPRHRRLTWSRVRSQTRRWARTTSTSELGAPAGNARSATARDCSSS